MYKYEKLIAKMDDVVMFVIKYQSIRWSSHLKHKKTYFYNIRKHIIIYISIGKLYRFLYSLSISN